MAKTESVYLKDETIDILVRAKAETGHAKGKLIDFWAQEYEKNRLEFKKESSELYKRFINFMRFGIR